MLAIHGCSPNSLLYCRIKSAITEFLDEDNASVVEIKIEKHEGVAPDTNTPAREPLVSTLAIKSLVLMP